MEDMKLHLWEKAQTLCIEIYTKSFASLFLLNKLLVWKDYEQFPFQCLKA